MADVIAAMLAPLDYDSFSSEEDCLKAYCPADKYSPSKVADLLDNLPFHGVEFTWSAHEVETQDWNAEWEETVKFEPIIIGDKCCIHGLNSENVPQCKYDIIIAPKMSFGSGHHETTAQLLEEILMYFDDGKNVSSECSVLDMGCGTAVLAILAARCGASKVRAIEIDDWVADNAKDNVLLNGLAGKIIVECGDASLLGNGTRYDLVLANINRNVLLADMHSYISDLKANGTLMMSGFYEEDLPMIKKCAESLGMKYVRHRSRNNWTVAIFSAEI